MVLTIMPAAAAFADGSTEPTLRVGTVTAKHGDIVIVDITMENNPGIAAISFELSYDKTKLEQIIPTEDEEWSDGIFESWTVKEKLVWVTPKKDISTNGVIVHLKFKVLDKADGMVKIEIKNCEACNYSEVEKNFALVAGGVESDKYTAVVTPPTCTEDGYTTHTCPCGKSYIDNKIGATGHDTELKNAKAATCTEKGYTGDKVCKNCGKTIEAGTELALADHDTELKNAKAATCTEKGYTGDKVCKNCKQTIEKGEVINALGHTEVDVAAVDPTCTKAGTTAGVKCSVCDTVISGCEVVNAPGHKTELINVKAATCTEKGYTGDKVCTVCKETIEKGSVTNALGHSYENGKCTVCGAKKPVVPVHRHTEVVDPAVAATCTKTGLTEGRHCSVCKAIIVAQKETPALGHTEVVDPAVAATCEKTGLTEGKHCSVCNEVLVAQKETPKTEHKFENGKCSVCGAADPNYVAPVVNPFKDVKKGDPFYDEIFWAYGNSIINGDDTGNYNPNDGITRAQIVMILWNATGNEEASTPSGFADVKDGAWYAKAVAWAVENGITNGTDLGFEPDRVCTRAEIVTFLHRANNKPAPAAAASFTDLTQDWYKDAVAWAVENGITKGVGGNRFAPNDTCTRGQAAAFMYRLAQLAK